MLSGFLENRIHKVSCYMSGFYPDIVSYIIVINSCCQHIIPS